MAGNATGASVRCSLTSEQLGRREDVTRAVPRSHSVRFVDPADSLNRHSNILVTPHVNSLFTSSGCLRFNPAALSRRRGRSGPLT